MLFYLQFRGKEHKVRVESDKNGGVTISLDDQPQNSVDLFFYGNDCSIMNNNKIFQANIVGVKHDYTVWRPEGTLNISVESEYRRIVGLLRGQAMEDENNVYAKMPGKIAKIMVKAGQAVEKGDPVLVMEAMKMENEIRASTSGEIKKINVSEGQAVETGALLLEIGSNQES